MIIWTVKYTARYTSFLGINYQCYIRSLGMLREEELFRDLGWTGANLSSSQNVSISREHVIPTIFFISVAPFNSMEIMHIRPGARSRANGGNSTVGYVKKMSRSQH